MNEKIQELLEKYHLGKRWGTPEVFRDTLDLGGISLELLGLAVNDKQGTVTGSAAGVAEVPYLRAFFELIERTSVVEKMERPDDTFPAFDTNFLAKVRLPFTQVFPKSPSPAQWVYSRSNGVAAHTSLAAACESASLELIERDRLLRSWFGQTKPRKIELDMGELTGLSEHYEFEAYEFLDPSGRFPEVFVIGIFGFPKSPLAPRIYGSAASRTVAQAVTRATQECLQGLGFLWGEELPKELPAPAPTPDFHQNHFLHPNGITKVRDWLAGGHGATGSEKAKPGSEADFLFVHLAPEQLEKPVFVVRAMHPDLLPLTFGGGPQATTLGIKASLLIHPFS